MPWRKLSSGGCRNHSAKAGPAWPLLTGSIDCAKRSSALKETQFFRGNDRRFTTYQCIVYRIDGGRIQEQVSYANWMDVYVQTGLVDLATLIA